MNAYTVRQTPFSDERDGESVDSEGDIIIEYLNYRCEDEMDDKSVTPSPLVPTISVTPHSPAGKHYPILEDNLQHLHYIHESIQHMRDLSAAQQYSNNQEISRLSVSCPSLHDASSDPDLSSNVSAAQTLTLNTPILIQSTHYRKRGSGDWELYKKSTGMEVEGEVSRRRSWAALDDLSHAIDSAQPSRQRSGNDLCSISLSSMESDMDDPFCESTANLLSSEDQKARKRQVRSNPNSSTHSLNEAELQNDFKKVVSRREAETLLLNTRLINSPLQKSVSTPSIINARELEANHSQLVNETSTATIPVGCQLGITESEDDEEMTVLLDQDKHLSSSHYFTHVPYDEHSEKRRKRGSLFFRKKKDKVKKATHQWITVCCGNSQFCDVCSKSLTNKPSVYCDFCAVTVHQNSCKDNIADCKGRVIKVIGKSASHIYKSTGKRGSSSNQSGSPNSQVNTDDDHHFHPRNQHDAVSFSDDVPFVQYEFLDEPPLTVHDLGADPFLGLQDDEPDSWTPTVAKDIIKRMKEKEIKRQEHLYEFILTEKHHCLTLKVMQKVFVEGLKKYLQLGVIVERMFPRLMELTAIHLGFLHELRVRQREAPVIEKVGDILLEQFSGDSAVKLKSVYGEFCSNHRNAIDIYKDCMQQDGRFAEFVKHCQGNPLLKKKGIPECILFVTQRLTKYPLLIEPLIKTSKDNKEEQERLIKALTLIKDILVEVDAQVAEKEKEDRKLEIYNKIDAKSFTTYRGHKFKKSDIFLDNRKLRFEGVAVLEVVGKKPQEVLVLVFSDVLCFLLENNNKYSFFTPENSNKERKENSNKAGVVSLQKLLVREKAGQEPRSIYLISSNPAEPEMFELKVQKPKDKSVWIKAIREAVQNCPEDDDENKQVLSAEEKQKQFDTKQKNIEEIVELLKQKDQEQAQLLEEKMALQLKLLAAAGIDNIPERPDYMSLVTNPLDNSKVRKDVFAAVKKVNQLAKSLYTNATNLSRSASSVGEHQSEAYVSPTLPKRAETFGGFDNNQPPGTRAAVQKKIQNPSIANCSPNVGHRLSDSNESTSDKIDGHSFLLTEQDHQLAATQLTHQVYTLSCIISHQMTTIDSLEAELASLKAYAGDSGRPIYRHNQQLEELRNLQDKLQSEREVWQRERDSEFKELQQKKEELSRLQAQLRKAEMDIAQQRDQLYRKLETLSNQGIMMSPTLVVSSSSLEDSPNSSSSHTPPTDPPRRKAEISKWKQMQQVNKAQTLPLNLISTTNQQKVASSNVQVRQQLPLKLAVKPGSGNNNTNNSTSPQQMLPLKLCEGSGESRKSTGYQRLSSGGGSQSPPQAPTHSRTGSSPAMMQNVPILAETKSCVKAGRTNTYPKLPDKFRVRSTDVQSAERVPTQNSEEEVIFF